ncbi:MAG: rhamnogalacturonan acetylesterase [Chitinophagaceae bacterium]|nr:rhamnogalacturonan acetylesterase [Chitinophagaceae bacterium]
MGKLKLLPLLILPAFAVQKKKITIYLAGDSTMSVKEVKAYPETGWGMPFAYFWDSSVTVVNKARNGRSTKTFISEGHWQAILASLREGDYVFIQFGHNDESVEKKDRYTPPDSFQINLNRFVDDVRARKATPVLLTPVSRRRFDKTGKVQETHKEYTPLVKKVAGARGVVCIDLDSLSRNLYQQFGEEQSTLLFLHLSPGEHPNYPEGKTDNTHFNELGARLIAQLVLREIRQKIPELAQRIVKRP